MNRLTSGAMFERGRGRYASLSKGISTGFLIRGSSLYETTPADINEEIHRPSGDLDVSKDRKLESTPKVRRRALWVGKNPDGSIYQGLRSDYLLSITLPCTLGMFGFVILLLVCMRTDGWLYHLFTDDYVPPALKKRLEEEARRAEGRRARKERDDDWTEVKKNWETELTGVTNRVKATMPPDSPQIQSTAKET